MFRKSIDERRSYPHTVVKRRFPPVEGVGDRRRLLRELSRPGSSITLQGETGCLPQRLARERVVRGVLRLK